MKKIATAATAIAILMTGAASAADMAPRYTKAPPPIPSPVYDWSGFYVGLNAGGAWGDDPVTYTPLYSGAPSAFPAVAAANGSPRFHPAGVTAGGQAGYNWQASQFVLGIEADIEYLDLKSAFTTPVLTFPGVTDYFFATSVRSNWMATIRPRVGVALDRFLLYIRIGYPSAEDEKAILESTTGKKKAQVNRVITGQQILDAQRLVREVHISSDLVEMVSRLVRATRANDSEVKFVKEWVRWGAGPRAGQAMILTAKARALLKGRFAVTQEDIQHIAYPVLRHRILMNFKAEADGITADEVTKNILEHVTSSMRIAP